LTALLYFLLLLYCCAVQYNDVDGLVWMSFYGTAALSILPLFARRGLSNVYWGISAICFPMALSWLLLSWPLNAEEWRETGGLLMVAFGHAMLARTSTSFPREHGP
jgi:hypothetical protein